jgi:hypothetical protein
LKAFFQGELLHSSSGEIAYSVADLTAVVQQTSLICAP